MNDASRQDVPGASPSQYWTPLTAGGALAITVFAIEMATPFWVGLGALYLVPLLLTGMVGSPRVTFGGAAVASVLMLVSLAKTPRATLPGVAFAERAVALAAVWTSAFMLVRSRETTRRLETRIRDLTDTTDALNQSAIVAATNTRGTITFVNDKFCEISKYSREELLGQDHRLINSGYHPKEFMRELWHTIANGRIWRGEIRNRAKDGSFYWVDTTIVPFLDARGRPYQYMAIRYEVTDKKRTEDVLREQTALARLGEMAAVDAHEVKNPIAGIRGALQVITSRMPADQRDRAVLIEIVTRLDALNNIVQDLLLFARPRQLNREPVELHALVENTTEWLRRDPALAETDVRIDGSANVTGDRAMLQVVVQNILMNAAQAMGGRGRIDVTVTTEGGQCRVAVADHGPGMPPEVRAKALDAFFTTKHRGTGLGLPIAQRLVQGHGGQLHIDASPGGGTLVSVTLPVEGSKVG